jgi:hypothetical protein
MLHEHAGLFNHNPAESKIKEFANRHRSAAIFYGNNDAVNAGFWLAECAKVGRKVFEIAIAYTLALSFDDFHAGIAPDAQSLDDSASSRPAAQHIDALTEC